MIGRLCRFTLTAYPPLLYVPFTFLWAAGITGLIAAADPRVHRWSPDGTLAITAATLFIDMFVIRALDDIRDLEYDRTHFPRRPLPSGMTKVTDLVVLVVAGIATLLVLNIGRGVALVILAIQLGYLVGLVTLNTRGRLAGDDMILQFFLNIPIQLLLSLYVYVAFLRAEHLSPSLGGFLAAAAVQLAIVHLEFARKTTRTPARAERTYVRAIGLGGTVVAAVVAALLATVLAIAISRPWTAGPSAYGYGWLAFAPLAVPVMAGWSFWRRRLPRWPTGSALGFPLCACAVFLVIGLIGNGAAP